MSETEPSPTPPSPAPRLNRDTLLLIGALALLALGVALTFLFSPATNEVMIPAPTATSERPPTQIAPYPAQTEPAPAGGGATAGPAYPAAQPTMNVAQTQTSVVLEITALAATVQAETALTVTAGTEVPAYPVPEGTPPAQPTIAPTATVPPPPTIAVPRPTSPPPTPTTADLVIDDSPTVPPPPTATPVPTATPAPTPIPALVLRGSTRWATGQSPIVLNRDVQIPPGSELIIEPGVEVRLAPGVSIYVDGGRMIALGQPDRPVRFVGATGARWSGIFGRPGGFIALEHTEIRGGGLGGTVLVSEEGGLVVRFSRITDNGGGVLVIDSRLEMAQSEIAGNDIPFSAALDAAYSRGNFVMLTGNRIGGNILSAGAPMVRVANQNARETLNLVIEGNLFRGGNANLQLTTNGMLQGSVVCNALIGDNLGLSVRSETLQVKPDGSFLMPLRIEQNFIEGHTPVIRPTYLTFGIGRGAASEIALDMRNNWWGHASGPYEPEANPQGIGEAVGSNITFSPWLTTPPACVPPR
ncbi:hypothetical protein [Chloroflexus sp.]|uniref:hypothetical protein n=1 Tax=Chloroflexus sp. TaxID=1904827 RepID=UPI00298F2536|nr:hypothetical protein [Chloroflexus sp.]MDW8405999.1 hypothetical protein [Chloroflexus sp.]